MGFMRMRRIVQAMWGKTGTVTLSDIGNGYMTATFTDIDDYYFALEGGPWLIQNHYLTVQTWKSNFNPWNEKIQKVTAWVRLPGLPGDYYDKKFFYNLGSQIGTPIKVDEMTLTRARTMYARLCVEIDLNVPLLSAYSIDGNKLRIEYEGLHLICFHYGKFGHDADHCPAKPSSERETTKAKEKETEKSTGAGEHSRKSKEEQSAVYGGWMVVQNSRKGRKGVPRTDKIEVGQSRGGRRDGKTSSESRFAVLEDEPVAEMERNQESTERRALKDTSNEKKKAEEGGKIERRVGKKRVMVKRKRWRKRLVTLQ
ncbi:uncharacterized protein LOC114723332 [Neltuma alba]|uniref:uncharacterized protein LOC114723332 n=1 Tax=Neltuma alba TaxID=207710 RepID=UPI0010A32EAB|nr:uncharacterized protein LOC114723332 [Prosopis alba]